jgi:mRNA-degrading endonuclease RelE of RelBE toxin-antitoxin system
MTSFSWTDWLTPSLYRVRVAAGAAEELRRLPDPAQQRVRMMLNEIAELADLMPVETSRSWGEKLLSLNIGRVSVRYTISEETRTLCIEHVVPPPEELDQTG